MKKRIFEFNGVVVDEVTSIHSDVSFAYLVRENGSTTGRSYFRLEDAILKAKSYWTDPADLVGRVRDYHRVETDAGRRAIEAAKLAV